MMSCSCPMSCESEEFLEAVVMAARNLDEGKQRGMLTACSYYSDVSASKVPE